MRIHIIDTCRTEQWHAAFEETGSIGLFLPHEGDQVKLPKLSKDDIVFAHTHEDIEEEHPDFPLTDWNDEYLHSDSIQSFVTLLRESETKPHVVLYSGGYTNETTREMWCNAARDNGGPLEGYPPELIRFWNETVARNCGAEFLSEFVNQAKLACQTNTSTRIVDASWLEEVKMSAKLLIEASALPDSKCHGITIIRPPEDLLEIATAIIEASTNGQDFVSHAEALCAKLDSLS